MDRRERTFSASRLAWLACVLLGAFFIVRMDIAARRQAFDIDARLVHGLLSQRAVQHEAILATLATLPQTEVRSDASLAAVYPQVIAITRRAAELAWPDPVQQAADERSRAARHSVLGPIDPENGHYSIVLAGPTSSFALRVDLSRLLGLDDWPAARMQAIRITLATNDQSIVLQPGDPIDAQPSGLTAGFVFEKRLTSESQPFVLRLTRATGPAEWPWPWIIGWTLLASLLFAASDAWWRARRAQRRAEELLRVNKIGRLNAFGEMAGGIAHELNQPLTAVIASAQAARRLLDDDPPALATAREAIVHAGAQARRASDVVNRLRRLVEAPDAPPPRQRVDIVAATRRVLDLLEPELRAREIAVAVQIESRADAGAVFVMADPVALEQIVHNLVGNAINALEAVPAGTRRLTLSVDADAVNAHLSVRDTGTGIPDEALARVFEPFYTTRPNGLGLGLSLCESLAHSMDGALTVANNAATGAEFRLTLPRPLGSAATTSVRA